MIFQNSGIFIINKPYQWTSNDVIRKIKSNNKFKKIGHAGTLDPLATGILPILVNDSTKYFDYFQTFKKSYLAEIKFGFSTSSYDLEGDIDGKTDYLPQNIDLIKKNISYFIGSIKQVPPKYSAIKKNGKRLYDYARNDEDIEIESREVEVSEIKIIDWKTPILKVIINCSSGFYVRSFANDLGKKLGSLAVLTSLSRINYGPFEIKDSINIENINPIEKKLISIDSIFLNNKKIVFDDDMEKSYYNGKVFTSENLKLSLLKEQDIKIYNSNDEFIGLLTYDTRKKFWKPKNIIRLF
ncbi:MAG: tRNA pseudouridine(55) synthase TruB [SAR202 cluster bacterium]|nr:tRNA pseudouridine(55) synthase TruB [SAR202 cluster bacterium]|tara:strand:+ start:4326 stop:5216 length:891 start_codon:yes stop_codon:yes gene_type:complete